MKKTVILLGTVILGVVGLAGSGKTNAEEIQRDGNTYWKVEAGDTLSGIGTKYGLDYVALHNMNLNTVTDPHLIFVDQEILISGDVVAPVVPVVVADEKISATDEYVAEVVVEEYVETPVAEFAPSDSNAAKEWIAQKESSGSYTAVNGQYYGRYQLNPSLYVGYDTTPAGQEAAADAYVANRYGSWEAAQAFWMANGWY